MSLENIEIHFRSRVSRSVNEKLAAAALVEKCCVAWRFDSWLMCQWSIENKSIFQDEKLLCFLFSYASYYRRSKLPSITHNNAHPRLDFQFRSHHLSRYHMPDFIFPFFPDLIRKHIIQFLKNYLKSCTSKIWEKTCVWSSDVLCCHDHRLLLKKLSLYWTTSWKSVVCKHHLVSSFPFSLCCGNNFEGGTFESPFSSAILLQRLC